MIFSRVLFQTRNFISNYINVFQHLFIKIAAKFISFLTDLEYGSCFLLNNMVEWSKRIWNCVMFLFAKVLHTG